MSKKFNEWAGREAEYKDFGRRRRFHTTLKLLKSGYTHNFECIGTAEYPPTLPDRMNFHFKPNDKFELDLWVNRVTGEFLYLVVRLPNGTLSTHITQQGDRLAEINWLPNSIWVNGVFRWGTGYKRINPLKFKLILIMDKPKQYLEQIEKTAQTRLM